ncbi:hypothetical protein ACLB1N_25065 [Escherichia coli]
MRSIGGCWNGGLYGKIFTKCLMLNYSNPAAIVAEATRLVRAQMP